MKTYIVGQRTNESIFRPTNWVDRIASVNAQFSSDMRLRYSVDLMPCHLDDIPAIMMGNVDDSTRDFVLNFAKLNDLKVITDCDSEEEFFDRAFETARKIDEKSDKK